MNYCFICKFCTSCNSIYKRNELVFALEKYPTFIMELVVFGGQCEETMKWVSDEWDHFQSFTGYRLSKSWKHFPPLSELFSPTTRAYCGHFFCNKKWHRKMTADRISNWECAWRLELIRIIQYDIWLLNQSIHQHLWF